MRHYVERIGADGNTVKTWSERRMPRIDDPDAYRPQSPPGSPPPGWADVGRPGQRRRSVRAAFSSAEPPGLRKKLVNV